MRNLNDIFRKDVTYNNITSHKKTGLHPLSRKSSFGKTKEGSNCATSLFRVNEFFTISTLLMT